MLSYTTLMLSSGLILFALAISYWQELKLEKDILIGSVRALIQLLAVGFILKYVFNLDEWPLTILFMAVMITVASLNAGKRGKGIPGALRIVTIAIVTGSVITLVLLLTIGAITFKPSQVIPVMGMIVGNTMVATGLTLVRLKDNLQERRGEVLTALSLGATPRQAVKSSLQKAVKMGMIPTIDGMKTIGIVQLPGMMTGLILAGANPIVAVRYQLMVVFMLSAAVAIACVVASLLAYRTFFNAAYQLKDEVWERE